MVRCVMSGVRCVVCGVTHSMLHNWIFDGLADCSQKFEGRETLFERLGRDARG